MNINETVEKYLTEARAPRWSEVPNNKYKKWQEKKDVKGTDIMEVFDNAMDAAYNDMDNVEDTDQFEHADGSLEGYFDQGDEDGSFIYVEPSKKKGYFTVYKKWA